MVTALCLDVEPETLARLQRHRRPPVLQEAHSAAHLVAALAHDPTATELVLLGRNVEDPLRLVHITHSLDEDLAILLLANDQTAEDMREALLFMPSLQGDVVCDTTKDLDALSATLEEAAKRTQVRRIARASSRSSAPGIETARVPPFLVRLVDHTPVGVVVLNARGRVEFCNPSAAELLAFHARDLIGRSFVLLFPEAEWDAISNHLSRCSATERRISAESFRFCVRPGHDRHLMISATPFEGTRRERGTMVFLEDRTLVQRDQEMAVRGEAHDVRRLLDMAAFGGDVGRRFRERLVAIVDASAGLQNALTDPAAKVALERLEEEARKATAIADQLLTFAGHSALRLEPVELSALVRSTLDGIEAVVPTQMALEVDLQPGLPTVLADTGLVRVILENLVSQAIEAIGGHAGRIRLSSGVAEPHPGRRLRCGADADLPLGPCVYLEIADDARDKDPSSRLQAFDRRSGSRTSSTNLPLAAVIGGMRSQGGAVEVGFGNDGGSTFRVLFPVQSGAQSRATERTSDLRASKVVLCTPDPGGEASTRTILEHCGLTVELARDRDEALAILRSEQELRGLLLDLDASALDPELVAAIRRRPARLPVILVGKDPGSRQAAARLDLQPAAFLLKPVSVETLVRTLRGAGLLPDARLPGGRPRPDEAPHGPASH